MALPQKLFSLLLVTLLACAMERRPRRGNCEKGTECSDDACKYAHPEGKMFCKRTPCKYGESCKYWAAGKTCRYLHQCAYEKGGRKRCRDPACKYDHLNNITINQAQLVTNQRGSTCQSHALAGWLTHWIETSSDPKYQELAHSFRCKAEGHRLYDFIVERLAYDYEHRRGAWAGMENWYNRALQMVIPTAHVEYIEGPERAEKVKNILIHDDMPLLFGMETTRERMNVFREIKTFGDHRTPTMQKFWELKDSLRNDRRGTGGFAGHAMLCCPDPTRGGFAIKNSWGNWGKKGIVYLRPERCNADSDFFFTKIVVSDHARLNDAFFKTDFYVR